MGIEEEKFMTAERIERIHEYVVQAVHSRQKSNDCRLYARTCHKTRARIWPTTTTVVVCRSKLL
jgi:hypothetical protein